MPFNSDLLQVMLNIVQVYSYSGKDSAGNPTYAQTPITLQCTYDGGEQRGVPGQPQQFSPTDTEFTIYAAPSGIQPRDKIVMDTGMVTYVQSIKTFNDPLVGDPGLQVITTTETR